MNETEEEFNQRIRHTLEAWEAAARAHLVGEVVTVPIVTVAQTTACVEIWPSVHATLRIKQMRAAGFGPEHWFAIEDYLKVGQLVTVRITSLDSETRNAEAEFLRLAS